MLLRQIMNRLSLRRPSEYFASDNENRGLASYVCLRLTGLEDQRMLARRSLAHRSRSASRQTSLLSKHPAAQKHKLHHNRKLHHNHKLHHGPPSQKSF